MRTDATNTIEPSDAPEGARVRIKLRNGETFKATVGANRPAYGEMMWVMRADFNEPIEHADIAEIILLYRGHRTPTARPEFFR